MYCLFIVTDIRGMIVSEQPKDVREDGFVIRELSFEIPPRKKHEDPITENQLHYLEVLAPRIEIEGGLERLGKWQASALIDYVIRQKKHLERDITSGNLNVERSPLTNWRWYFFAVIAGLVLFAFSV